jgi:hypothetical protein
MSKLFIPQQDIDRWMSSGRVELRGDALLFRETGAELRLRAAALFLRVAGDGPDKRGLVGKVKDETALAALGAEAYMTSVLFDDTAYDVEAGFVATFNGDPREGAIKVLAAVRSFAA